MSRYRPSPAASHSRRSSRCEVRAQPSLRQLHRGRHAVHDGYAVRRTQVSREIRHPGAAEHDGFGSILGFRQLDLRANPGYGVGCGIIQFEHRHLGGAHAGAAPVEPVFQKVCLDGRDGARQRGDHRETVTQKAGEMKRRLTNSDDRRVGGAACRLKPGIVEARHDMPRDALRLALGDFGQQARHAERLVVIALD